ncbi:MAG: glycosyltransferase family 2 protein [Gammaproteobacteria bacterium]|nr:glycosyltransferase family 2 protein [Gammaproteobacteria bacterium]
MKRIVRKFTSAGKSKGSLRATVDTLYESGDTAVLWGWILVQGSPGEPSASLTDVEGNPIDVRFVWVHRPDVEAALKPQADSAYCSGFIAIAECRSNRLGKLHVGSESVDISQQAFVMVDSMAAIIGSVPAASRARVTAALEYLDADDPQNDANEEVSEVFSVCVDTVATIVDKYVYLNGWIADPGSDIDLIQVKLDDQVLDITNQLIRYPRHDLRDMAAAKGMTHTEMGFFCVVPCAGPVRTGSFSYGRRQHKSGLKKLPLKFGSLPADEVKATRFLLAPLNVYSESFATRAAPLLAQVFEAIWEPRLQSRPTGEVQQYGKRPESPKTSVIIPIYGRYDFIQHQLLHFSSDKDFANTEIIYVLDDPSKAREFFIACNGAFQTFGQAFTTVYCGRNLGYAGANNLGVEQARGEFVLLLNSDIIPREKGWLSKMLAKFTTLDAVGILGGKLVYEDNSIQHMGMRFQEDSFYPGVWMNYHPYKGFPESLAPAFTSQEVESVTGACMLMKTEVYRQVGGFDTHYLLGDFEDSDLCMKVRQQGLKIYADGENCLYHLERQSQNLVDAGDWKFKLTLMNGMRQKKKWDQQIKDLKNELN